MLPRTTSSDYYKFVDSHAEDIRLSLIPMDEIHASQPYEVFQKIKNKIVSRYDLTKTAETKARVWSWGEPCAPENSAMPKVENVKKKILSEEN